MSPHPAENKSFHPDAAADGTTSMLNRLSVCTISWLIGWQEEICQEGGGSSLITKQDFKGPISQKFYIYYILLQVSSVKAVNVTFDC